VKKFSAGLLVGVLLMFSVNAFATVILRETPSPNKCSVYNCTCISRNKQWANGGFFVGLKSHFA
jgi:hypothetical protein